MINVDDALASVAERKNITNSPLMIDDDADWSPDGQKIVFHRAPAPQQMWMMNADGSGQMQLTFPPGFNTLANWGVLRVRSSAP